MPGSPLRIAVLHPSYEGSSAPFAELDPACDPGRYLPEHEVESFHLTRLDAVRVVGEVARAGFDVAVNLCDGAWGEDRPGIEVVEALERAGLAFTGAGRKFYDPSREAMKMACAAEGIRFPAYAIARAAGEVERALDALRFPMIVKPPNGYSSVGLTPASRVETAGALAEQAASAIARFGAALIEEFVEGREFTVLVAEPRDGDRDPWALAPVEFVFPRGESWKHFDLKWRDYASMDTRAVDDEGLGRALRRVASRAFAALGGSGYARCDVRVDRRGEPFFLEINPNPGVFYPDGAFGSADFILAREPGGHRAFLDHVIAKGIARRDRARRAWTIRHGENGFGIVAARPVRRGEVVVRYEGAPTRLMSADHVARHLDPSARATFDTYAWPVSPSVYGVWSEDPEEWCPINHACDPSAWLVGLDLVARRDLAAGDAITADYATFSGARVTPFECACGAPACRGTIRGTDIARGEVRAAYGDHVSDDVRIRDLEELASRESVVDRASRVALGPSATGQGLFAARAFDEGEAIVPFRWWRPSPTPTRWTVQCGEREHAEILPAELSFMAHSCDPNVDLVFETMTLRARRPIAKGEELAFFYPSTEWEMSAPFACVCGAAECVGTVGGAHALPRATLARHRLSPFVRARAGQGQSQNE